MKRIRLVVAMTLLVLAGLAPHALAQPYWVDGYWEEIFDEHGFLVSQQWFDGFWACTDGYRWVEGYWVEDWEGGVVVGQYWVEGYWEPCS